MTSQFPPGAVPGPDGVPEWEEDDAHTQPDPFGEETDQEGKKTGSEEDGSRDDPRAQ